MKVDRLVQTAATVVAAAALGVALYEAVQKQLDQFEQDDPDLPDLAMIGKELLTKKHDGEPLEHFLRQKYTGLFLIGRAGTHIPDAELDELCSELGHFHKQCYDITGHDADRSLVEWYECRGVGLKIQLSNRLVACHSVEQAFDGPRYIASAITGMKYSSLPYDLDEDEWYQIKHYFNL